MWFVRPRGTKLRRSCLRRACCRVERKRERRCRRNGRGGDEGALCPGWPVNICDRSERYKFTNLTVETSHNLMDLSSEPEASVLLSGDQAMVEMPAR